VDGNGAFVRQFDHAGSHYFNNLRGMDYDPGTNSVFMTQWFTSAGYIILKMDYSTGAFLNSTNFTYGNDIVIATDGRLGVTGWNHTPGIFTSAIADRLIWNLGLSNVHHTDVPEPAVMPFVGVLLLVLRTRRPYVRA